MPANCCPDENRFDYTLTINNNIINLIASDTAVHLCRSICNYKIEITIDDLTEDNYTFICNYENSVYYNEQISRSSD